jgi:hypothetical protein
VPLFLLGHAGGKLKGNLHVMTPDDTPMANVWLTVLNMLGVEKQKFADSTAALDLNPSVSTTAAM